MEMIEKKTMLDIPFARKVLEFAEVSHQDFRHNQAIFLASVFSDTGYKETCGTTGCLAGIAVLLSPRAEQEEFGIVSVDGKTYFWCEAGALLMGLTDDEADRLFWCKDNNSALDILRSYIKTAEEALLDS